MTPEHQTKTTSTDRRNLASSLLFGLTVLAATFAMFYPWAGVSLAVILVAAALGLYLWPARARVFLSALAALVLLPLVWYVVPVTPGQHSPLTAQLEVGRQVKLLSGLGAERSKEFFETRPARLAVAVQFPVHRPILEQAECRWLAASLRRQKGDIDRLREGEATRLVRQQRDAMRFLEQVERDSAQLDSLASGDRRVIAEAIAGWEERAGVALERSSNWIPAESVPELITWMATWEARLDVLEQPMQKALRKRFAAARAAWSKRASAAFLDRVARLSEDASKDLDEARELAVALARQFPDQTKRHEEALAAWGRRAAAEQVRSLGVLASDNEAKLPALRERSRWLTERFPQHEETLKAADQAWGKRTAEELTRSIATVGLTEGNELSRLRARRTQLTLLYPTLFEAAAAEDAFWGRRAVGALEHALGRLQADDVAGFGLLDARRAELETLFPEASVRLDVAREGWADRFSASAVARSQRHGGQPAEASKVLVSAAKQLADARLATNGVAVTRVRQERRLVVHTALEKARQEVLDCIREDRYQAAGRIATRLGDDIGAEATVVGLGTDVKKFQASVRFLEKVAQRAEVGEGR